MDPHPTLEDERRPLPVRERLSKDAADISGRLVFLVVLVVFAGIFAVIDIGMLRFAGFAALADYDCALLGIVALAALAILVGSQSVLIAGAVGVVVGVPVVLRINIATVVAAVRIAASVAAIVAVVTTVVAAVGVVRVVPITVAATGASCG